MDHQKEFANQLNHRTIREFKNKSLSEELINNLLEVANHTATSMGAQSYSIIRIRDQEKRRQIAEICGQEYVARAPELWIFIVDSYRNGQIAKEQDFTSNAIKDMDKFFQGFTDGAIAAQNVVNAVESVGLGAVYFGSILNDAQGIIDILNLPELTFPIVGIGFGEPNQEPQLKPRMPLELKVFTDEYEISHNYLEKIKEYDKEMQTYYDLRDANRRVDSFSRQIVKRFKNAMESRQNIVNVIVSQGFDLMLK